MRMYVWGGSPGGQEWEGMLEWDKGKKKKYLFNLFVYFKCSFLSLCQCVSKKNFNFMLCILINNKDLFDWLVDWLNYAIMSKEQTKLTSWN